MPATPTRPQKPQTVTETHTESLAGVGAAVDREASIIRGVKLIGHDSKNGRAYPPETLRAAVDHYQGVRVNVDHPAGNPSAPRSVAERIGMIQNARYVEGRGIFGDFRFNPKHTLTEQVLWDAENNPAAVGFSHNATLSIGPKRNGRAVVEAIVGVRSVDLVADPATTASLFEHDASDGDNPKPETEEMSLKDLTVESLRKERPDLVAALEHESGEASELETLRTELEQLKADKAARELADTIEAELTEAKLDPKNEKHVSKAFRRVLESCTDKTEREELIADRAELCLVESDGDADQPKPAGKKPVTTPATEAVGGPVDLKEFARALRRR